VSKKSLRQRTKTRSQEGFKAHEKEQKGPNKAGKRRLGSAGHQGRLWFLLLNFHSQSRPEFREPALLDFSFLTPRLELNFVLYWERLD
jgi:hypothetical protein